MECLHCSNEAQKGSDFCAACEEKELSKIGGWLYFPALSLAASIVLYAYHCVNAFKVFLASDALLGAIGLSVLLDSVVSGAFVLGGLYLAFLFVKKRRRLPAAYILWIIIGLLYIVLDLVLAYYVFDAPVTNKELMSLGRRTVAACIWIAYFRVSVRVKKTFIH